MLDESQEWVEANRGVEMARAIRRNAAKLGSARSLETCNAHRPGEGSVAEETYEAWKNAGGDVPGLMYDSLEAPAVPDLTDTDAVIGALEVARGDSTWLDLERLADEIADPTTPEHVARRYYFNQVVSVGEERWMDAALWQSRARPDQEIPPRARVVLGFDGGWSHDWTALVACTAGDDRLLQLVRVWKPEGDGWTVPVLEVMQEIRDSCRRWRVQEIVADASRWGMALASLAQERLPIVEFPQQSAARMVRATGEFMDGVRSGQLTHCGQPDLTEAVLNAIVRETPQGDRLQKRTRHKRIDPAIAAVMAHDRALHHKRKPPRVIDLNEVLQRADERRPEHSHGV